MQALESLNDSQVNDFLSGKTPLNLSMRLGDHMMLIQLQLSTVNPSASSGSASSSAGLQHSSRARSMFRSKTTSSTRTLSSQMQQQPQPSTSSNSSSTNSTPIKFSSSSAAAASTSTSTTTHMYKSLSANQISEKYRSGSASTSGRPMEAIESSNEFDELRNIMRSIGRQKTAAAVAAAVAAKSAANNVDMDTSTMSGDHATLLEQSPIKSLSNLVSGPIKTSSLKSIPMNRPSHACKCPSTSTSLPTQCDTNDCHAKRPASTDDLKPVSRSATLLHRTLNNPIAKTKPITHAIAHHSRTNAAAHLINMRRAKNGEHTSPEPSTSKAVASTVAGGSASGIAATAGSSIDSVGGTTETLAEASRNLTKTLRKLSKEVFSGKSDAVSLVASEEKRRPANPSTSDGGSRTGSQKTSSASAGTSAGTSSSGFGSGTVIESMRNHGIYSGTFSGTLNPALQDRYGRPKRDISTVIHILNDLLSATPHYSRGARISFEPAHSSRKYVSNLEHF